MQTSIKIILLDSVAQLEFDQPLAEYPLNYYKTIATESEPRYRLNFKAESPLPAVNKVMVPVEYPLVDGRRVLRQENFWINPRPDGAEIVCWHNNTNLVDWVLRHWMAMFLLPPKGALFHSAAAMNRTNGGGFLFIGRTEAGKTTLANNIYPSPAWKLFCDELNVAVYDDNGWRLMGTPFWGDFGLTRVENPVAPLRGVCVLAKGKKLSKTRLSPTELTSELLKTIVNYGGNDWYAPIALAFCQTLAQEVPGYRMVAPTDTDPEKLAELLT